MVLSVIARGILGFVLGSSGSHKLKSLDHRFVALGLIELLLAFWALMGMTNWAVACSGLFLALLGYRTRYMRQQVASFRECKCGVPSFGKNFNRDTLKVGVLAAISMICVPFAKSSSHWLDLALTCVVGTFTVLLALLNPAVPSVRTARRLRS